MLLIAILFCSIQLMAQKTVKVGDVRQMSIVEEMRAQEELINLLETGAIKLDQDESVMVTRTPAEGTIPLGSSGNWYTIIRGESNMISADNDLNSIVFIHRNDPNTLSEGNVSHYRLDISNDGGQSFNVNLGPLNPTGQATESATGVPNSRHRYPQARIMNPAGNTDPSTAYLFYCGATHNQEGDSPWDGTVSGGSNMLGEESSWTENVAVQNEGNVLIPASLCRAGDDALWATDYVATEDTQMLLYKADWDGTTAGMTVQHMLDPNHDTTDPQAATPGAVVVGVNHIGFDESGTNGYTMAVGDAVFPECDEYLLSPFYYTTNDGGETWNGPNGFDMSNWAGGVADSLTVLNFDDGAGNITTVNTFPQILTAGDLEIDANGDPHFASLVTPLFFDTTMDEYSSYSFYGNIVYAVDISYSSANDVWSMTTLAPIMTYSDSLIVSGASGAVMTNTPRIQLTASADRTKMFFTYTDSTPEESDGPDNLSRNLFGIGLDVNTGMTTEVKDFTSTNADWAGKVFYGSASSSGLQNGSTHTVPYIFSDPEDLSDGGDLLPLFFQYYQDCTFDDSEFTQTPVKSTYTPNLPTVSNIASTGTCIALEFTGDIENACDFWWDFGDGETSTEANPLHIFPNEDGDYTVTLYASNFDGTSSSTLDVNIVAADDPVAPTITLDVENEITIEGDPDGNYQLPGYSAEDDICGVLVDVTSIVDVSSDVDITTLGEYTITYEVSDGINTTTETVTVNVVDTTPPQIQTEGPPEISVLCGSESVELPDFNIIIITDNFDGPIYNSQEGGEVPWNAEDIVDLNNAGSYNVTISAEDSSGNIETETVIVTVLSCTGIDDVFGTSVEVFPNPVEDILYINTTNDMSDWTINVYDLQGRVLKQVQGQGQGNNKIDMTSWSQGMYLLNVITPDASATERIVLGK